MTPSEHDREHAAVFADYRQALREGTPRGPLIDMLRNSDRQWARQWPRYYHVPEARVLHTDPCCAALTGKNSRARVALLWWLSGQRPTMPICRKCCTE
jgi:hypothetical protein